MVSNKKLGNFKSLLTEGKKSMVEVVKMVEFREAFMVFLEKYLVLSGLDKKVAILANLDLFVNVKMCRKSLIVFKICNTFTLLIYELPAIALPTQGLMPDDHFKE